MVHIVERIAAVEAATAGRGYVTVALVVLLMGGAFIAIVSMVAERRLLVWEIVCCGVFFTLLGGSPVGRSVWDFIWTLGG